MDDVNSKICTSHLLYDNVSFYFSSHFTTPSPATRPLAKHAVNKYPPVGASQSNISPAQKNPGNSWIIKFSSSDSNVTPPALLMASSNGRGAINGIGNCFINEASLS